jgi:serine/threonine protein phosphatase PrpC
VSQSIAPVPKNTFVEPPLPGLPFALGAYGETDVGRVRGTNEDCFAVIPHLGLFMVADGMGGAAAGEVASHAAIEQVRRAVEDRETTWSADAAVSSPESGPRRFIAGIRRANRVIHALAQRDPSIRGMGTTFAGILLLGRCAVVAHVGDSRVYRLRQGELERMTHDHSLAHHLVELGVLRPQEVATFAHRNIITRAVGPHETVDVDTKIVDVRPGDVFLICSDGLTGELGDDEIAAILRERRGPGVTVGRLVDRANEKGGADNITAVLVVLGEAPGAW